MESGYEKPMNIGSDRAVSIDELADMVIAISGKRITKLYDPAAPQGVRGRNADLTLVKRVLGWEPSVSLEEGLERTYRWIEDKVSEDRKETLKAGTSPVLLGSHGSYLSSSAPD